MIDCSCSKCFEWVGVMTYFYWTFSWKFYFAIFQKFLILISHGNELQTSWKCALNSVAICKMNPSPHLTVKLRIPLSSLLKATFTFSRTIWNCSTNWSESWWKTTFNTMKVETKIRAKKLKYWLDYVIIDSRLVRDHGTTQHIVIHLTAET